MKKIRTGIASFGMSGKIFHAPFLQAHPGYELAAIVERHKNDSRELYPDTILYRSVEDMLADDSLELIIVNTPVQLHVEHTRAALLAGKHVVTEKPFTVTPEEARDLDNLAKEKGLLLSVYQNRRYDCDYRAVKKVIGENLLGKVVEAEIRYDRYRPEASGKQHKEGDLPGSGTLHDLGAHLADQALQLFGRPEKVFADLRTLRSGVKANDYFEILLYYPELRVRLKSTMLARETYPAYIIHGTEGSFFQQRSDVQEELLAAGQKPSLEDWAPAPSQPDGLLHTRIGNEVVRKETTSSPGNYMGYYQDLYKTLRENAPNAVPAAEAVQTMELLAAAERSATEGKVIEFGM
jgi:scyllo-inositol 2-dehydrogenase (NADP+)